VAHAHTIGKCVRFALGPHTDIGLDEEQRGGRLTRSYTSSLRAKSPFLRGITWMCTWPATQQRTRWMRGVRRCARGGSERLVERRTDGLAGRGAVLDGHGESVAFEVSLYHVADPLSCVWYATHTSERERVSKSTLERAVCAKRLEPEVHRSLTSGGVRSRNRATASCVVWCGVSVISKHHHADESTATTTTKAAVPRLLEMTSTWPGTVVHLFIYYLFYLINKLIKAAVAVPGTRGMRLTRP
jgi:hypothetical protein